MEAFPCEFYTVNYLLVIELIRQFLLFGTFKIWYLKSAYVLNWMDSTCKPAPWWASRACLMQEFKNEIKEHFPLSISRTAWWESALCCRHLVKLKSVRARGEMDWSASVWLCSGAGWIWKLTKSEWNSGQKARNNYFRLQNASTIHFARQLHSLLVLKDHQYYLWTKFDDRRWKGGGGMGVGGRHSHCVRWKQWSI